MKPFHAFRIRVNKLFVPMRSARIARRYRALGGGPATILANNCAAGRMLHDLGQRLLEGKLEEVRGSGEGNPVADLRFGGRSVRLHFLHEATFASAKADWERRRVRVNPARTFLVATDNSSATAEELDRFLRLPWPKKMFVKDAWKAERLGAAGVLVRGDFREGFNVHDFPGWFGETYYQRSLDFASWIAGGGMSAPGVPQRRGAGEDFRPVFPLSGGRGCGS